MDPHPPERSNGVGLGPQPSKKVARHEYADGSPGDDAAGMLQVVTAIGWELIGTDLTSAVRVVIPGGMASWGGLRVLGKDSMRAISSPSTPPVVPRPNRDGDVMND